MYEVWKRRAAWPQANGAYVLLLLGLYILLLFATGCSTLHPGAAYIEADMRTYNALEAYTRHGIFVSAESSMAKENALETLISWKTRVESAKYGRWPQKDIQGSQLGEIHE